jgi:hypothetical protein
MFSNNMSEGALILSAISLTNLTSKATAIVINGTETMSGGLIP